MSWGIRGFLVAATVCVFAVAAGADTLELKDGRTFKGQVMRETLTMVEFEVHQFGAKMVQKFKKSDVKSLVRGGDDVPAPKPESKPAQPESAATKKPDSGKPLAHLASPPEAPPIVQHDKPTYYLVPIEGEIGTHVIAGYLEKALSDAEKRKPSVVVLRVDSPGGSVSEVDKLVEVIRKYSPRLRLVVLVKEALSAAAVTSLACKEIYVEPDAVFGAATAFRMSRFGMPQEISEKFQSIWRAKARAAAETGGHEPLLAEAMIDNQMELHVVEKSNGEKEIRQGKGKNPVTTKGKLLTLTAKEAVHCGLAVDIVTDVADLGRKLGYEGWTENQGLATPYSAYWSEALEAYEKRMKELGRDFEKAMKGVTENDIEHPNVPYRYFAENGLFTGETRRRRRELGTRCLTHLVHAEKVLKEAAELTQPFEEFQAVNEDIERLMKEIKDLRAKVILEMNKKGPDG